MAIETTPPDPTCPYCKSSTWLDMGKRKGVKCGTCGSLERTRVIKVLLDNAGIPKPGSRILHFAPERPLYRFLSSVPNVTYDACDLAPENYKFGNIRKFDLCADVMSLESETYDLIIHSHVMEHIPCDVTAVLFHLHRALKPAGVHVVCIPIMPGRYSEDLGVPFGEEATRRFGQEDHVRLFGVVDIHRTFGMVFKIDENYDMENYIDSLTLDKYNIPMRERKGFSGSSVFMFGKDDIRLVS